MTKVDDIVVEAPAAPAAPNVQTRRRSKRRHDFWTVNAWRLAVVVVFLSIWEWVPQIPGLSKVIKWADPFYISSPSRVAVKVVELATGSDGTLIWPYMLRSIESTFIGLAIGMALGALAGLVLSNFMTASKVLQPFLLAINTTPIAAFIPIIVILFGATQGASIAVSALVVFFLVFFNAYEGGRNVSREIIDNARLLGANAPRTMRHVRLPYVMAWTLAALPVAVSNSLLAVIFAEIMVGDKGLGKLVATAQYNANATLTMALALYLATLGVTIVTSFSVIKQRVLHWWGKG